MATREHARPEKELLDIVLQYPGLEDPATAEGALRELRNLGWVVNRQTVNATLTVKAPGLTKMIADYLSDPDVEKRVSELQGNLDPSAVRVVGPMNDEHVYSTYLELLKSAQNEICLPMLVTSTRLTSVEILQERARRGVRLRILVGSPKVVAAIRGEKVRATAEQRIKEWVRNFSDLKSAEVRVSYAIEDMWLASGMAIDGRTVRLDIYDPERQRSLQGMMLEFSNPRGFNLNGVMIFMRLFNQAWRRARPITRKGRVFWSLRRTWKVWVALGFAALAPVPVPYGGWKDLSIGISAALIATVVLEAGQAVRDRRRKVK